MIRVRQVKVKLNSSDELIRKSIANKLKINVNEIISFKINKQSIDARDKENVHYICEYDVKLKNEEKVLRYKSNDILLTPDEKYIFNFDVSNLNQKQNNTKQVVVYKFKNKTN